MVTACRRDGCGSRSFPVVMTVTDCRYDSCRSCSFAYVATGPAATGPRSCTLPGSIVVSVDEKP